MEGFSPPWGAFFAYIPRRSEGCLPLGKAFLQMNHRPGIYRGSDGQLFCSFRASSAR